MYKITQSSLENIKSVFGSNTFNESRYDIIDKRIHPLMENFEFAKPYILENSGIVHWKSKHNYTYESYETLTNEDLKEKIDQIIYNSIQFLEETLPHELNSEFLSDIIELPSNDAVFYFIDTENKINVVLTEWGFIKDELDFDKGVLRKIKPASLNSGIILFEDKNGNPVKNVKCKVASSSFNADLQADQFGGVKLNGINRREEIIISSPENRFKGQKLNFNNKDEAIIIVKLDSLLNIKVVTHDQEPVSNFKLSFESALKKLDLVTDSKGEIIIVHPEFEGEFILYDDDQQYLSELIPVGEKNYVITIDKDVDHPVVDEEYEEEIEEDEELKEEPVVLEFLTRRKKPIIDKEVELYGAEGKKVLKTDRVGHVKVDKKAIALENTLFVKFKKSDWKKDFKYNGEEKLTFIIKKRRFMWWWIPAFLLFFFLFSLIPFDIEHHYVAFDAETNERLSYVNINAHSNNNSAYSAAAHNQNVTDSNGNLIVNYGSQSLFDQMFNPSETSIFAEKDGYNSLYANVPLGFNDKKESWLFLNKNPDPVVVIVQPPIQEEIVTPCGGGENEDETGVQLKKFDLGKANVSFLFEYYNQNEIDIIIVRTDAGEELFRFEDRTETVTFEDSIMLNSPSRYVEVEVIGDSNWGIRVNCPD